ncbi:hypothetical protein PSACC_01938 [Paramicrosporidium saccamoebae]|uniref:Uncharacterized protein n=1 Tax=Paramicrosporidium saccamoebae TaxID=1246581 RepID=A0A2H9TKR4_9FUNG|nr:hypothetical protein PSACC_01938 [Paramicrosporidium saccamoebae]
MAGNWLVPARRCMLGSMNLAAFVKERSALFRDGGVNAGVFVCGNEAGGTTVGCGLMWQTWTLLSAPYLTPILMIRWTEDR